MRSNPSGGKHRRGRENSGTADEPEENKNDFLVAAIGASAGGIEAFTELISNVPPDTDMAFVLVQHLDPTHHSMLAELFSKKTEICVKEVADGMKVEPNNVYVIPPNATMSISNHTLQLGPREESHGVHMPIDRFMRTLAEEQGNRAIGVILSGSGTDGTLGMAEIQAQGGVTFAQEEASAKYESMPRSAIGAGCVDYVLSPKGIARELARIARHPYLARHHPTDTTALAPAENAGLNTVFQLLRRSTGVDFSHYRQTTILRRIQRRMLLHKIDKLEEYMKYMQTNSAEIKALYQDLLINVTSFFRNPKAFEALKTQVFPNIMKNRSPEASIRIWTAGRASGQETYSVAITLLEYLGDRAAQTPIQLFGTDVNDRSIAKARAGIYPENIQGDVSPERLRRFFTKVEGGYRISKSIRDMCIFAQHNVLNDPPFSQMDLICCRNLLIYLEPMLQNKVISLFHYASRPGGYLYLGSSEGVGRASNLFATVDRAHKIFSKKTTAARQPVSFSLNHPAERPECGTVSLPSKPPETAWNYVEAQKEFDRRLLSQYAPATVFINEDMEIIHTRGNVNRYLKLAPGRASLNLLKMAREGLLLELRNAINKAKKGNAPIRKQNIQLKNGNENEGGNGRAGHGQNQIRRVRFEIVPISLGNLRELYFMIVFQDERTDARRAQETRRSRPQKESETYSARIAKLEQELAATKEYLQSVIETQEATNEELQSANEEILSSNEELQTTNEELETAKEELQSANEELSTVNDELRSRNLEITQVNNDLTNLFASIDAAVVIIGSDLTIRRFTPEAQKFFGLIPADIGRPLLNINPSIDIPDFQSQVLRVMTTNLSLEKDITDADGQPYQLRILPYRTAENKNDGAVINIIAISGEGSGATA
jgi:two-component system, chemotaxis family, CheB/CheR fusion protein